MNLRELYAKQMGYFWLPCPVCGDMFGGHETSDETVPVEDRHMLTCRKEGCVAAGRAARQAKGIYFAHELPNHGTV